MTSAIETVSENDARVTGSEKRTRRSRAGRSPARSHRQLVRLLSALATTANEAGSPREAMQTSLKLICEQTGWALGRLVVFSDDAAERRPVFSTWHVSQPGGYEQLMAVSEKRRYSTSGGRFVTAILRDQRPTWIADIEDTRDFGRKTAALDGGLRCAFGFPVIVGGHTVALLEFYAKARRPADAALIQAAVMVGAQLARLVERRRSLETTAHLAAIVESSEDAIISRSLEGTITSWNGGAERMFGYSANEAVGRAATFFHPPGREPQLERHTACILRGEVIPAHESQGVTKDGRLLDVLVSLSPVRDASGEIVGASLIIHNISEQKADEHRLRRATRAHAVLAACSHALVRASDESQLLQEMCRILVETGGYVQAYVGYPQDDEAKSIRAVAQAGFEPGYLEAKRLSWSHGGNMTGRAFLTGERYISRNLLTDPNCAHLAERARIRGFQSMISLPLRVDGTCIGGLSIYAREPDAFDDDEIALIATLTDDISFGIAALRREAARRDAEARRAVGERQLRETFEQAAVGITRTNLSGIIVDANQKVCDLLGYTKAELIGKSVREITHADDFGVGLRFRERLERGEPCGPAVSEKRFLRKNGSSMWARRSMSVARDERGTPYQIISMIEDITDSKDLARRYQETFDQAAIGIAHTAMDGTYIRVNQHFCRMVGYSEQELVGKSPDFITHPDDIDTARRNRTLLLEGKVATETGEKRYVHKSGHTIWARRTASIAYDELGKPMYAIRMIEDITDRKEAAERYRATFDAAPIGIMHSAVDTERVLQVNSRLCGMLGYTADELLKLTIADLIHPDCRHTDRENYRQQMLDGVMSTHASERKFMRKDGSCLWANRTVSLVRSSSGEPQYFVRMVEDISERKRALEALATERALLRTVVDAVPERIYVKDIDGRFVLQNTANVKAHGAASYDELLGKTVYDVFPSEIARKMEAEDKQIMESGTSIVDRERSIPDRAGRMRWTSATKVPLRDGNGNVLGIVGMNRDITERKQMEQKLTALAHYDVLTGLPNRALFNERVTESLLHAQTARWITGVMFIDVDRFKNVNDTLGHAEGDKLLKQVSQRLSQAVRRGDTVGRLGGDEFAVVLTNLAAGEDAGIVAEKIVAALAEPFELAGSEIYVSASIGIALHPEHAQDQDALIKNADAAMYEAKRRGRNGYQFYTPDMNARAVELLGLENSLRRAVDRNEFVLHFQPKSSVSTGEITGFEALLRWLHPDRGLVSPLEFIPILEETGLIVPVGAWVLEAVCTQITRWQAQGIPVMPVSINISARQFAAVDLAAAFKRILTEHGTDPALIELELTESALMANTEDARRTLDELKLLGLSLSIDDFGTGYSSLAYLKRFPIDTLKIDRSFVKDITEDEDDAAITLAVISMAHSLGLKVVAEGVETCEQLQFLREHGCDQLQGYYLSKPMPADACTEWIGKYQTERKLAAAMLLQRAGNPPSARGLQLVMPGRPTTPCGARADLAS